MISIRVFEQLPTELAEIEKVEVASAEVTRNIDPRFLSWKGATIFCGLDSFNDCWLSKSEWELHGLRALREKAPFVWL